MRIFALSDVHIDYQVNREFIEQLSDVDYQEDILILAGDLSDRMNLLEACFKSLASKFYKVMFVPGNHDLWVKREQTEDSLRKFALVKQAALDAGLCLDSHSEQNVTIVPFLSWYDYSFATPCDKLNMLWMDFRNCVWPEGMTVGDVTDYFHQLNQKQLDDFIPQNNHTVISFSHFLPRIDLMPHFVPEKVRYLYPALGSADLDEQIRSIKPNMHIYGHSHLNRQVVIEGIRYINNAFAYPSEANISLKRLFCIYNS